MLAVVTIAIVLTAASCISKKSSDSTAEGEDNVRRLVLYYSQEGSTKAVAEELQKQLKNVDIEAIEVEEPYDGTYDETIQRVLREREAGVLPKVNPLKHNIKDYDVIYLGYPIWFGTYAPPIASLIDTVGFYDTKITPFCTFGSGGLEASVAELREKLLSSDVADGYGVRAARIDKMPAELHSFLLEKGHILGEYEAPKDFSIQRQVTQAEADIFNTATAGYKFPLGTAVTCGKRFTEFGLEYMFVAKNTSPEGAETYSTVFVLQPFDEGSQPEFTRVVR